MNKYESLGYIESDIINLSFTEIEKDFKNVFNNTTSTKNDIIKVIKKYVPNFKHIETGKNLDQKM